MKVLKECKLPETVIFCGAWVQDLEPVLKLTDDECGLEIKKFDGKYLGLETYGHLYMLSLEQFNTFINSEHWDSEYNNSFYDNSDFFIVLKDYVGTLGVIGMTDEDKEFDEWDIKDYFYHQMESDEHVTLSISGDYEIKTSTLVEALTIINSDVSIKVSDILDNETKEQLFGEIENQGFGYWVQNYGYRGDEDEELRDLCKKGKEVMNKLQDRLTALGIEC